MSVSPLLSALNDRPTAKTVTVRYSSTPSANTGTTAKVDTSPAVTLDIGDAKRLLQKAYDSLLSKDTPRTKESAALEESVRAALGALTIAAPGESKDVATIKQGYAEAVDRAKSLERDVRQHRAAIAQEELLRINKAMDDRLRLAALLVGQGDRKGLQHLARQVTHDVGRAGSMARDVVAGYDETNLGTADMAPPGEDFKRTVAGIEGKARAFLALIRSEGLDGEADALEKALEELKKPVKELDKKIANRPMPERAPDATETPKAQAPTEATPAQGAISIET